MQQAFGAGHDLHEGTEVHHAHDLAFVDLVDLRLGGELFHATLGFQGRLTGFAVDLHAAVVFQIDGAPGFVGEAADGGAALADHVADFLRVDLQGEQGRGVIGDLGAGFGNRLGHLAENVQPAFLGLLQRLLHDLLGDALDLDVHLQGGHAARGTGHLEVHVAEVILVTEDVGQHREAAVLFLDQTHGDAGHRGAQRYAGVHQRHGGAAHRRHGGGTVGFGDFGHHAD